MEFNEYSKRASLTAVYPQEITASFGFAYTVMGLCGESDELIRAEEPEDVISECGDEFWYVVAAAREMGIALTWPHTTMAIFNNPRACIQAQACRLAEIAKKIYRNRAGKPTPDDRSRVEVILNVILLNLKDVAEQYGFTLQDVAEANLKKVENRLANDKTKEHDDGDDQEEKDFIAQYLA